MSKGTLAFSLNISCLSLYFLYFSVGQKVTNFLCTGSN